jgi:hypothetical protein
VAIGPRPTPRLFVIGAAAIAAHRDAIEQLGDNAIWRGYLPAASARAVGE